MPRNIVIPEHVRNNTPGKRAAHLAARLAEEARKQEEARLEAERLEEARRAAEAERELEVVRWSGEIKTAYAERLAKTGDPIIALSTTGQHFKAFKERISPVRPAIAACISEAWKRFQSELPLLAYS